MRLGTEQQSTAVNRNFDDRTENIMPRNGRRNTRRGRGWEEKVTSCPYRKAAVSGCDEVRQHNHQLPSISPTITARILCLYSRR
jgi:hypothetical protein